MTIVYYISGHGFGHASRSLELIGALAERSPGLHVVVRASVSEWFLTRATYTPLDLRPAIVDTGVVQVDSLRLDEESTALHAARFYETFEARVDSEAALIGTLGASLVVGDVPPLAFAAAARAGVPSIAVANFTWDWIYGAYPQFERAAPGVIDLIRASYAQATLALRLPLHGGFDPMRAVTRDIPFIARRSRRARADVRRMLELGDDSLALLASFGAYGVDASLDTLAAQNGVVLLPEHAPTGLRYADLVLASDVVISKPGYGIISECIANGAPLLYTSRGHFIEYDMFVEEMPKYLRCRFLSQEDLLEGRWRQAIEALRAQPDTAGAAADALSDGETATSGAIVAAEEILRRV